MSVAPDVLKRVQEKIEGLRLAAELERACEAHLQSDMDAFNARTSDARNMRRVIQAVKSRDLAKELEEEADDLEALIGGNQ